MLPSESRDTLEDAALEERYAKRASVASQAGFNF